MIYDDYIQLLRNMVRTPSLSFKESEVCGVISDTLVSFGIEHEIRNGNIIALNRHFDRSKKTLALDAHIDTVPANNGYARDPFDPSDNPDIVFGLGSNDDGGSVVSMIAAFRHFYEMELPFNLMLILSREEECSGNDGTRWMFSKGGLFDSEDGYPVPDWMIVGEPTGMRAATSERGLLVIDAEAHGVSGHAARGEGVNALYIAIHEVSTLRAFKFGNHPQIMGDVMLNVTQIEGGKAHNVIPDLCTFVVDIRPTEQYTNEEITDMLQAVCKSTLKARNLTNRSSATAPRSPLLKTGEDLGIGTYSSPTTSDWMRVSCDAIKMGPGDSSRSHKANEYIMTSEISDGIQTYIKFIESFYGNTLE